MNQEIKITYKSIWGISYPIIIGLVAQNLMVVIDTIFLGRLGEVSLGAAAIGGLFHLTMVMLGTGFGVGMQILIGRRNGEGSYRAIGRFFDHGLYFMLFLSLALFLVMTLAAPQFLQHFINSPGVLEKSLEFISYRRFGFLFGFCNIVFNSFYFGTVRTRIVSVATLMMASSNALFNYILIFGKLGMPALGVGGAALATNLAEMVTFSFYLFWTIKNKHINTYRLFKFQKINKRLYSRIFKLAGPVMLQYFIAFSAWFAFFMVLEKLGETALAASNITRSVYMFLMIPVWGLSSATTTLVSNLIGGRRINEVFPLIKKILVISIISNLVMIQGAIFFPEFIISFFTQSPELTAATRPLLFVISGALVVFSVGMIFFSALSGTGKTTLALKIEMIAISFYLLFAFAMVRFFDAGAPLVWVVEILYFALMGLGAFYFLKRGKWKELKI